MCLERLIKNAYDQKNIDIFSVRYASQTVRAACGGQLAGYNTGGVIVISVSFREETPYKGPYAGRLVVYANKGPFGVVHGLCETSEVMLYMDGRELRCRAGCLPLITGVDVPRTINIETPRWIRDIDLRNPMPAVRKLATDAVAYSTQAGDEISVTNGRMPNRWRAITDEELVIGLASSPLKEMIDNSMKR